MGTEITFIIERVVTMSARKTYHVTQSSNGDWKVKAEKADRASATCPNKAQAIDRAVELAKSQSLGQVVIHKQDGSIQSERTYGKDPYPPKG